MRSLNGVRLVLSARCALVALACALSLGACSSGPLPSYELTAAPEKGVRAQALRGALVVEQPSADDSLDSERILVRTEDSKLAYLSDARWSDRLPDLVQSRLIASFQNAKLTRTVGRPGDPSDYALQADIRKFEIDVVAGLARIELAVRILSTKTNRPLAARMFSATAPAPTTANGAAAAALDKALADIMRSTVAWTATQI